MISLIVVINGPVAKAGSILNLCNASGINVPKIEANKITASKAVLTVIVSSSDVLNTRL